MLSQHLIAKDQAIEKLCGIIKELVEETKGLYIQLQTKEAVESIPKKKGPPAKTVIRWEPDFDPNQFYQTRDRAVGIVYDDGFFEFARYLGGTKVSRTHYASFEEWMNSLPAHGQYSYE